MVVMIIAILVAAILGPILIAKLLRKAGGAKKSTPAIQFGIYGLIIAAFGGFAMDT